MCKLAAHCRHQALHVLCLMQGSDRAASYRRTLQQRVNDPLVALFGLAGEGANQAPLGSFGQTLGSFRQRSFLQDPQGLPLNVHLLTLKDNGEGKVLLRLAHLYQVCPMHCTLLSQPLETFHLMSTEQRLFAA